MALQYSPHTIPLLLAAVVAAAGALVAWQRRRGRLELWGVVVQLGVMCWALIVLATISVTAESHKFLGLVLIPAVAGWATFAFLVFTIHFVGREHWLTRPRLVALFAYPALMILAGLTNDVHGLMYTVDGLDSSGYVTVEYTYGPLFYALVGPAYLANLTFIGLLFQHYRRSRNVYRTMTFILFVSVTLLTISTIPTLASRNPFPHFSLFPYTYLALGVFLLLGTSSAKFLRTMPVDRLLARLTPGAHGAVPTARDVIVQEINEGIIVLDTDDVVVDINERAKRMIGADRPVGQALDTVVDTDAIISDSVTATLLDGGEQMYPYSDEVWVQTPDGSHCYDVNVSQLRADGDSPAGHVILLHDITRQKRREEQLREREAELRRQKADLQRQTSQLEHQNEQLDKFAGIVSHDLRNPLNVARGRLEFTLEALEEDDESDVETDHLEVAAESLVRMEDIIDDALTLARQGRAITDTEQIALNTTVRKAWDTVDTVDATLENCEPVTIESDEDRLLNVFENLFRNAVEHGRSDVTIGVGLMADGFFIEDDGPGIPDEEKDDVFEEGFTTAPTGTGFGLAIVEDVIRAHGWEVTVTDGSNGGARFEITGVDFSVTTDHLVETLAANLEEDDAERLVASAVADADVSGPEIGTTTAISVLERIPELEEGNPVVREAVEAAIESIQAPPGPSTAPANE